MSSIKKRKKKKVVEPPKVSVYESIPDEVKISFGKFYSYSLIYIIFFSLLYPLILMYYLNKIFTIILFILLIILYCYIIFDIRKRIGKYRSIAFVFFIILVFFSISFSVLKLII